MNSTVDAFSLDRLYDVRCSFHQLSQFSEATAAHKDLTLSFLSHYMNGFVVASKISTTTRFQEPRTDYELQQLKYVSSRLNISEENIQLIYSNPSFVVGQHLRGAIDGIPVGTVFVGRHDLAKSGMHIQYYQGISWDDSQTVVSLLMTNSQYNIDCQNDGMNNI